MERRNRDCLRDLQKQTDYKPRLVKGRTGWIIKGLIFTSILGTSTFVTTSLTAYADDWTANSAETIRARIKDDDASYTFVEGDTFYEIANALNIRFDVLMKLNGFEPGSQYSVPVGTTIKFEGNRVTVTDKDGNQTNQSVLSDRAKVDPNKTFINQADNQNDTTVTENSSTEETSSSTTSTNQKNTSTQHSSAPTTSTETKNTTQTTSSTQQEKETENTSSETKTKESSSETTTTTTTKSASETETTATTSTTSDTTEFESKEKDTTTTTTTTPSTTDKKSQKSKAVSSIESSVGQDTPQPIHPIKPVITPDPIDHSTEMTQLKSELATLEAEQKNTTKELTNAKTRLEDANKENKDTDTKISAAQEDVATATKLVNETNALHKVISENHDHVKQAIKLWHPSSDEPDVPKEMTDNLEEAEKNLTDITTQSEKSNAVLEQAKKQLADVQNIKKQDIKPMMQDISSLKEKKSTLDSKISIIKNKISTLEKQVNSLENLENKRKDALTALADLNLLDEEVNSFNHAVFNATSTTELDAYLNQAKVANKKNTDFELDRQYLHDEKIKALATLEQAKLSDEQVTNYTIKLSEANSLTQVQNILLEAKNEEKQEATAAESELLAARKQAITHLMTLNVRDQKDDLIGKINAASTVDAIQILTAEAETLHQSNQKIDDELLAMTKKNAQKQINGLNLKPDLKKQIHTKIEHSQTKHDVQTLLDFAIKQADNNRLPLPTDIAEEAAELSQAIQKAILLINNLNLPQSKQLYLQQLHFAQAINEVDEIVEKATIESKQNDFDDEQTVNEIKVANAKKEALVEIKQYSSIDQKSFTSEIMNAATLEQIEIILATAKANNAAIQYQQKLDAAKRDARAQLGQLNLKGDSSFEVMIHEADKVERVQEVLAAAKTVSANNTEWDNLNVTYIEDARQEAFAYLMNLNLNGNLGFYEQIRQAQTINDIQYYLNAAIVESAKNDQQDITLTNLEKNRSQALATLTTFNLKNQFKKFEEQIKGARSTTDILNILAQAQIESDKNKHDAQKTENADITKLSNAKKDALGQLKALNLKDQLVYNEKINRAKDEAEIKNILKDAESESSKNDKDDALAEEKQKLEDSKNKALKELEELNLKLEKQNFITRVTKSTSLNQVQSVMNSANQVAQDNDELDAHKSQATITFQVYSKNIHMDKNQEYQHVTDITLRLYVTNRQYRINFKQLGLNHYYSLPTGDVITGTINPGENKVIRLNVEDSTPLVYTSPEQQSIAGKTMLKLLNQYRHDNGLSALVWNQELENAAELRATEIATVFSHTRPNGLAFDTAIREANQGKWSRHTVAGENNAIINGDKTGKATGEYLFNEWRKSPKHNENLLNPDFEQFGIGFTANGTAFYAANIFTQGLTVNGNLQ